MKKLVISILGLVVTISTASALSKNDVLYEELLNTTYVECLEDGDSSVSECKCIAKCIADGLQEDMSEDEAKLMGFRCGWKCN